MQVNRPRRPFSRLELVPRLKVLIAALALAVSLALGLVACGGSGLLSGTTASEITSNLEKVPGLVAEGNCAGAEQAVDEIKEQVDALEGVNGELKEALSEAATQLEAKVSTCEEEETTVPSVETEETAEPEEEENEKAEREEKPAKPKPEEEETAPTEPEGQEEEGETNPAEPEEESSSGGVSPGAPAGEG